MCPSGPREVMVVSLETFHQKRESVIKSLLPTVWMEDSATTHKECWCHLRAEGPVIPDFHRNTIHLVVSNVSSGASPQSLLGACNPEAHPLSSCRWFVSGHTGPSPHCALGTVVQVSVLLPQAAHLQIEYVLAAVSGDGESALHRVGIVCNKTIITDA